MLDDGALGEDGRFEKFRPILEWWRQPSGKPPARKQLDPFSFGGVLVGYLVLLEVLDRGRDFRWRTFGGRHVQAFGADLTNVAISDLVDDHPAAKDLRAVMQTVLERRRPVPFEIRYMSENRILRQAVGVLMPLTDDKERDAFLFGAADWIEVRKRTE